MFRFVFILFISLSYSYSSPISDAGYSVGFVDFKNDNCGYDFYFQDSSYCYTNFSDDVVSCYSSVDLSDDSFVFENGSCVPSSSKFFVDYSDFSLIMAYNGFLIAYMIIFYSSFFLILNGRK